MGQTASGMRSIRLFVREHSTFFTLLPVLVLLVGIYMFAVVALLSMSFYTYVPNQIQPDPILTLENYQLVFSPTYFDILTRTLWISLISCALTVFGAYPLAYYLARSKSEQKRKLLLAFLISSFFLQLLVRIFAFLHVFGRNAVVNQVLMLFGLEPVEWLGGPWPVIVSMAHQGIPLAVLVQMGAIKAIDPEIEEAAKILGASNIQTFYKITLPLSLAGIVASILLSFTGAASAFITPMILGGGRFWMMGNYIYFRFSDILNYPLGAAMSFVLFGLSIIVAYGMGGLLSRWIKIK